MFSDQCLNSLLIFLFFRKLFLIESQVLYFYSNFFAIISVANIFFLFMAWLFSLFMMYFDWWTQILNFPCIGLSVFAFTIHSFCVLFLKIFHYLLKGKTLFLLHSDTTSLLMSDTRFFLIWINSLTPAGCPTI